MYSTLQQALKHNAAGLDAELYYDEAFRFCKKWFKSALDEGLMIWRARNLHKHNGNIQECTPYLDLRSDYFAAVRYLDSNGFTLPDKSQIRSMRREGMQRFIDKADDVRAASSILAHLKVNGKLLSKEEKRSRQRAQRQQQRES